MNKINREEKISYDCLYELYMNQKMTTQQIADKLGLTYGSVNYYLNKYCIKKNGLELNITKEELQKLYCDDNLSLQEIAKIYECCYYSVSKYIRIFGLKRKDTISEYKDILYDLYINQKKSTTEISKILGWPKSRVRKCLMLNGISLRSKSECQQIFNSDYKSFGTDWSLLSDALIKRCRRYFSNHIAKNIEKDRCSICGSTINLHIHHKKALSIIVREIANENPLLTEDELYEKIVHDNRFLNLDNLIVVCEDCHYTIFHPYLGYKKANQKPSHCKMEGSTTTEIQE